MDYLLNKNKIEYVLFHLNNHVYLTDEIISFFCFEQTENTENKIIFRLSSREYDLNRVKFCDGIPVLFPDETCDCIFSFEKNNLIFHHDLLKSSFYLLSGYHEFKLKKRNELNRFPYDFSVQKELNIIKKPVVNYYFEMIIEGIEKFLIKRNIKLKRKIIFDNFAFMKTCDVDRIEKYHFPHLKNQLKYIFGMKPEIYSCGGHFEELFLTIKNTAEKFLGFSKKKDPYFNFDFIRKTEKKYGIDSCFYFLSKGVKNIDSYYNFSDKNIKKLICFLEKDNCEIGLHGSVKTVSDSDLMKKESDELQKSTKSDIVGCRQHRLTFHIPETGKIMEKNNFAYDASLGFAEHEGFRNSYCFPFKLYDFVADKVIDVWEFPLNVMDGTLFDYRNLDFKEALNAVGIILEEIVKFNGLFVLLWHNSFFDERKFPGITDFYRDMHKFISEKNPLCLRGKDILLILNNK